MPILIYINLNGTSVVGTIQKGKDKLFVVTSWKLVMSNALDAEQNTTPMLYVRNDFDTSKVKKDIHSIKDSANNSSIIVDENGEPLGFI